MPKKILVLVSNPKGTIPLDLLPEINRLKEELRRSLNSDRFTVEWEVAVKRQDLRRHILDIKPQMIHFCGHGTAQGLVLEDDQGNAKPVSNEFITQLLKEFADRIECVLLNACDSGTLADDLGQHLNYVIGMSQPVRDDAAIAFAEAFYAALGAGESYERAFEIGRAEVLGLASFREGQSRKAEVLDQEGRSQTEHCEYRIPVLKVNPNPTPIKPLWLSPEVERQAVRDLLGAIESGVNRIRLFHTDQVIVLQDQYIPIQVTLERRYRHTIETIGGYGESEAELRRIYAMKGSSEAEIQAEMQRQQVDWDEAKRERSRTVVLADPGMGKSTLLCREAGTTIQQAHAALDAGQPLTDITLPLLVRLSTLADELGEMSVTEAILKILRERHSNLLVHHDNPDVMVFLKHFLQSQLLSGRGLLLLDALDEVPDAKRTRLLEKLNEFAGAYKTCPIVATSRIVGYGGKLVDGAKEMEIVPFNQKQTEQYIETWFTNARPSIPDQTVTARGLIQALRDRPQLAGLAQNPLLLSLICSLYQQDKLKLPARRSQIYEQAVNCMLGEWNRTRPDYDNDRTMAKLRLLEAMAYHFTREGQEVFDYEDLYDWVESYLEGDAPRDLRDDKTGELIAELSEEDGILQKLYRDRSDRQYLFLHRTFQEYFTASHLKRSIKKHKKHPAHLPELVKTYCWTYRWHETLTLLAGLLDDPMALIEAIVTQKDDVFQTQLLLAGRCLAECRETSHLLADRIIDRIYQFWLAYPEAEFIRSVVVAIGQSWDKLVQVLQTALNRKDFYVRRSTAETLGNIGSEKVADALIQALDDEDTYIRRIAVEALGNIGSEKATDALIQALTHENLDIRRIAVEALGNIGSEKTTDALIRALTHKNSDIRLKAAEALGKVGSEKATDALIQTLADENSDIRLKAAEALGKVGSEKTIDALVQALFHKNSDVRQRAAWALGNIGNEKAIDVLIQALSDEDSYVRYSIVGSLGKVGSEKAIDALIQALSDKDSAIRQRAAGSLGNIGSEKAIDVLIQVLSDRDSSVRQRAAEVLGNIGSEKAIDALIQVLSDRDSSVRQRATEALGNIGSEKAIDALIQALSARDSSVRQRAAEALGNIGNEKAIDALIQALSDKALYVRTSAAGALSKLSGDKAIDALIQALSDKDFYVRTSVAEALGKLGSDKAIDALIQALSDENSFVRRSAAWALGKLGSDKAIDAFIQTLSLENSDLRHSAVWALGKIGSNKAIDALVQVLSHEDSNFRRSAAEALGGIGSEKAIAPLIQALSDKNPSVRGSAAKALGEIGNVSSMEELLQLPNLEWDAAIFTLARRWAVRFSESGSSFIPVYPEKLPPSVSRQLDSTQF